MASALMAAGCLGEADSASSGGTAPDADPGYCPTLFEDRYRIVDTCEGYDDTRDWCDYAILTSGIPRRQRCESLAAYTGTAEERAEHGEPVSCGYLGLPDSFRCWLRRDETSDTKAYVAEAVDAACTRGLTIARCGRPTGVSEAVDCLGQEAVPRWIIGQRGVLRDVVPSNAGTLCGIARVVTSRGTAQVPTYRLDLSPGQGIAVSMVEVALEEGRHVVVPVLVEDGHRTPMPRDGLRVR